jgi:predicted lipoprotein with Yx(FWY)xxD motif
MRAFRVSSRNDSRRLAIGLVFIAGILGVLGSMWGIASPSNAQNSTTAARLAVVKSVPNRTLGTMLLVNRRGKTLYHLSVERHGKFICTNSSCLSLWSPLLIPRRTTPTGVASLATVKRPDGHLQVTYKGAPLYSFTRDKKPGDLRGNGFRDVGIWRPATVGAGAAKPAPTPPPTTTDPYGGGYGDGYGK